MEKQADKVHKACSDETGAALLHCCSMFPKPVARDFRSVAHEVESAEWQVLWLAKFLEDIDQLATYKGAAPEVFT